MKRKTILVLALLGVFAAGAAFGKHRATLKDVNRDLDAAEDNLSFVHQRLPAGTDVALQLSMAEQNIRSAKKHLLEYATQEKEGEPKGN
jgi:hypothetical protein